MKLVNAVVRLLDRHRTRAIAAIALGMLVGVLAPLGGKPSNRMRFAPDGPGIELRSISQALSEEPVHSTTGEMTVELWIAPRFTAGLGNQEIFSFHDDELRRPLLLGQFPRGYLLRGRADNPTADPREDRYLRLEQLRLDTAAAEGRHLALTISQAGARLHVDGRRTRLVLPETRARAGEPFGGRLLVGSSNTGWRYWRGDVAALAIHDRVLSRDELRAHAERVARLRSAARAGGSSDGAEAAAEVTRGLLAFYPFSEGSGRVAASALGDGPELLLPRVIRRPTRPNFLYTRVPPPAERIWLYRDMALNVLFFAPLGAAIAWRRGPRGIAAAALAGLAFSLGIEIVQSAIPGRSSSAFDVACNAIGALLGGALAGPLARRSSAS